MATLILTDEFKKILEKQEVITALSNNGYNSADSFIKEILKRINGFDASLNLRAISYHTLQDTDTYIGIILDEYLNKLYNICVIPPILGTRSGFLSQQIFGFISNLVNGCKISNPLFPVDKPVIIVNCMVDSLADSAICNIIGAKIMGFNYIDIFNRKEDFGSSNLTLANFVNTISNYKDISKDIELTDNTLVLKTQRLKDFTTSLTNEPYYFAITAYPAVILAKKEGYKIDIDDFEDKFVDGKSNKNIKAFITFVKELNAVKFSTITSSKYLPYIAALRTKPFMLLAGISGTGKSRIVRKMAQASITEDLQKLYDPKSIEKNFDRWELHKPVNFELVQVKPNWHNSLEVVGYKSNIGGPHYEFTPFVEFVARAWKHQDIPFFLCLDEMNLAPVEQYFAEFLSAIESRSIENDEYETDPIIKPFSEFDTRDDNGNVTDKLSDRMIAKLVGKLDTQAKSDLADRFRTKGLTLPKNLFVLGTVNMDETTFSFSRKVLDRAMSIVMNDVEYDKFFKGETDNDMAEFDEVIKNLLIDRPIRGLEADDNGAELIEEYLTAINEKLNNTPFKLGYRAANEALLYVSAAHQFNSSVDVNSALDEFTLMKILSRIEGDKRSIGNLLQDLQQVINESYPASNKKLVQMAETLQDKQFVSYWT